MAAPLHRERRALAMAVRELRARKALRQEEVLDVAGLGRNYLTTLESGRFNPSFDALVRIANGLDVPLSEVVLLYEQRLED